ncbi:MAG: hypothetical protein V7K89_24490 [Nostoc sp.]|uniref:hypothetical protein n=1 Tax=Nostoc sp. TaxID=1180 RepID=UPI002FFBD87B
MLQFGSQQTDTQVIGLHEFGRVEVKQFFAAKEPTLSDVAPLPIEAIIKLPILEQLIDPHSILLKKNTARS